MQPLLALWRKSRGEDLRSILRLVFKQEVVGRLRGLWRRAHLTLRDAK
jgi:hypothetical protein